MARKTTPTDDLLDVLAHMQVANNVALMALLKSLEMAGAIQVVDYESLLRGMIARMYDKGDIGPASLLEDLADRLKRDGITKQ